MDYKGRLKGQKSWQIKRRRMEPEKLKGNWIEGEEEHVWEKWRKKDAGCCFTYTVQFQIAFTGSVFPFELFDRF